MGLTLVYRPIIVIIFTESGSKNAFYTHSESKRNN